MFKAIYNVDEAWSLLNAGLLWWNEAAPAQVESWREARHYFEARVPSGLFSILLEE